jgi:hypothetical protein
VTVALARLTHLVDGERRIIHDRRAIADSSQAYADQNEADFASLQEPVRTGRRASQTDI